VVVVPTEQSSFDPLKNAMEKESVPLGKQRPIGLHNSAKDVAIVAAKSANDDVQWIYEFCEK
jgi:hypothetical protein